MHSWEEAPVRARNGLWNLRWHRARPEREWCRWRECPRQPRPQTSGSRDGTSLVEGLCVKQCISVYPVNVDEPLTLLWNINDRTIRVEVGTIEGRNGRSVGHATCTDGSIREAALVLARKAQQQHKSNVQPSVEVRGSHHNERARRHEVKVRGPRTRIRVAVVKVRGLRRDGELIPVLLCLREHLLEERRLHIVVIACAHIKVTPALG
jgi:hypothetical protein